VQTVFRSGLTMSFSSGDGLTLTTVAAVAGAASTPAGIVIMVIGSVILLAKWIFDVYQNTFVSLLWDG
jgi:hypothetical protein